MRDEIESTATEEDFKAARILRELHRDEVVKKWIAKAAALGYEGVDHALDSLAAIKRAGLRIVPKE